MLSVFSPAKINLFLRVLGKRVDGYHELSTMMQTIDLGDILHVRLDDKDSLTCQDPCIPTDHSNLIIKAAQLFRQKTGIKWGLKVHLNKRIPIQAGLGGGSSNAATTLWAFNELAGKIVSNDELQNWSAEIGSDIPFFFSQGTAHCTGRGEQVKPLPDSKPLSCLIVKPVMGLSTPAVYQKFESKSAQTPASLDVEKWLSNAPVYFNDLEIPAFEIKPELRNIKTFLMKRGYETVLMSGSGSAFFCLGKGDFQTYQDSSIFSARFLNRYASNWYQVSEH